MPVAMEQVEVDEAVASIASALASTQVTVLYTFGKRCLFFFFFWRRFWVFLAFAYYWNHVARLYRCRCRCRSRWLIDRLFERLPRLPPVDC